MDETGAFDVGGSTGFGGSTPIDGGIFSGYGNDVFGTILNRGLDAVTRIAIARAASKPSTTNVVTQSAPVPAKATSAFNPFPGLFSSTPQADGKNTAANVGGFFADPSAKIIMLCVAIFLVMVLALRR